MLKQRVLTACIGLALLTGLLAWAPESFLIIIFLLFVVMCTYEAAHMLLSPLERLFAPEVTTSSKWIHTWLCALLAGGVFVGSSAYAATYGHGILVVGLLGAMLLGVFLSPNNVNLAMSRLLAYLVCVAYGVLPWLAIWDLYVLGDGPRYFLFLLAVVWSGDTAAYFGGLRFGKHKLAPVLSPKKTIEGAVIGLLASLVAGCLMQGFFGFSLSSWSVIVTASLLGGLFGQMGDLVESLLKRFAGVKDSGAILPGHGGFLDRVDGLLFAAPVIWFILHTFKGA